MNEIPPQLQLTPQDYEALLNMIDKQPTTGLNAMRFMLSLEQKLIVASQALLQPAPPPEDPPAEPPADPDSDGDGEPAAPDDEGTEPE